MKTMPALIIAAIVVVALAVTFYVLMAAKVDSGGFNFLHNERTRETGTSATARVLAIRDAPGRLNKLVSVEFDLEVMPATGAPFKAMTRADLTVLALQRFQPGAIIAVKYDPADHTSVAVIH